MLPDPSVPDADQRGLTARYFSNTTLSGQPALERTALSSEAYTLYLLSDGGARLWVDNQLVIDRWQPPFEPLIQSSPVELKADAKADIRVEYYSAGHGGEIHLLWSSASTPKQIITQRYLYPEAATNKSAPADTNKQTGMLLPESGAGPKTTLTQPSGWPAIFLLGVFLVRRFSVRLPTRLALQGRDRRRDEFRQARDRTDEV